MSVKPPQIPTLADVYRSWRELADFNSTIRTREGAGKLGVSEARLTAALCAQGHGVALRPAPAALLARIPALGRVRGRTRNRAAALESIGTYGAPDIGEHTGIVIGENIDLRVFPSGWNSAFALTADPSRNGERARIVAFDATGAAAHEVCLLPDSDMDAFDTLVRALESTLVNEQPLFGAAAESAPAAHEQDVDAAAFRAAYAAMQDTHDFFMLLRRFNVSREAGLRLAGIDYARRVAADAHRRVFARATEARIPLMIFVASEGMVQISSGTVPPATPAETQFAVLDPRFNFHLDEASFARSWVVRKPTINGIVTSLELYADDGALVLQIFGERHEGRGERPDWAAALDALA